MVRRVPVSRLSRPISWTSRTCSTWAVTTCPKLRRTMFQNSMPVVKAVKTWAVVSSTHSPHHRISRTLSEMTWFEACQQRRLGSHHKRRVRAANNLAKLISHKVSTFASQPILTDTLTTVALTETRKIPTLNSSQTSNSIKIWWVHKRQEPECHHQATTKWTTLAHTSVKKPCDFGRKWTVTQRACQTRMGVQGTMLKIWPKIDER